MPRVKPLILVDASSYLYRAFYAMPPLTNSQGQPTGAVYGVVNMVRRLMAEHKPELIAMVFDAKGKTFRDDLYAAYKQHRPRMPDDMAQQIGSLHAIIQAMGLPLLAVTGVEADDVIGTLACQAAEAGMQVAIYTGDKDFAQLVNNRITLVNTMTNTVLDPQGVIDKFGVAPERIVDYLALVGDSVDNIPGVPKVGPGTAVKWLKHYGTLDAIIEHAAEIGGKVGENLRDTIPLLPVSRQLLTIKCDVELDLAPHDLRPGSPDVEALRTLYKDMEFKSWFRELAQTRSPSASDLFALDSVPGAAGVNAAGAAPDMEGALPGVAAFTYSTLLTQDALADWLVRLAAGDLICLDLQTTGRSYMDAEIVGIAFALDAEAAYLPLAHDYLDAPGQLNRTDVLARLKPLLEDAELAKLGHDLKFTAHVLANYGIDLAGGSFDTMLESYVLDSTATRHDIDSLALKYLNGRLTSYEAIAGKGARQLGCNEIGIAELTSCAAEQAGLILRLHHTLWPQIAALPRLKTVFAELEMPLVRVLTHVERNGVSVDAALLRVQSGELAVRMREIEEQAFSEAGQPFNLGSPLQIQEILYDKLGLPVLQKTPKGQPSTAEPVLQELAAADYPLPALILQHRAMSKLKSTYTDALPEQINPRTGRIHTSYRQAVAATGRLSSTDPNLQNIPIRSSEGRRIRQAFIAAPGYQIMAADYSQIELRIMAHLSGDQRLLEAFAASEDIHRITAADVFGVPLTNVTLEQRRAAKAINFGLIYGMSSFGLARQLNIDRPAAEGYIKGYFARYPLVKIYMDRSRDTARELGYVETVLGRRLYVPQINDRNAQRRQYAERTAINAPLQGTAADIIKQAMLSVDGWLTEGDCDARMVMQVHDELVFEVADGALQQAECAIRERMIGAASLSVPLVVEVGIGADWDKAH